jgi:selenocysteine lyase/cysteine desulfurase
MNIQDARNEFPALEHQVFLDSACVSLAPQRTVRKLREFLDVAAFCPSGSSTQHHIDMDTMRRAARPQIARLINASEEDIALVESTTHGLHLLASAIPLQRGDRVIISGLEFLEVALPWLQKRDEIGIAIDVLPNREGKLLVEDVEAAITRETHLLAALHQAKIKVVTPEEHHYRSGIVTFSLDSPAENAALIDFLRERKVLLSLRHTSDVGGVRVGCHLFNNTADLDHLVEHTIVFARQQGKARA